MLAAASHFEYHPAYPSLFLSTILGIVPLTYVQVHIRRRRTSRRDWKLKSADWSGRRDDVSGALLCKELGTHHCIGSEADQTMRI